MKVENDPVGRAQVPSDWNRVMQDSAGSPWTIMAVADDDLVPRGKIRGVFVRVKGPEWF